MINLIKKLYISSKFEKYYFSYLSTQNKEDLKKAMNMVIKLKDFIVILKENDNLNNNYKALSNNLTAIGKINDLLYLQGDLDNAQKNIDFLRDNIEKLLPLIKEISKKDTKEKTFKEIAKENGFDFMLRNFKYLEIELKNLQFLDKKSDLLDESEIFDISKKSQNLYLLFEHMEKTNNNTVMNKFFKKAIISQMGLINANLALLNIKTYDILEKKYDSQVAKEKTNDLFPVLTLNNIANKYNLIFTEEEKEKYYLKQQKGVNFINSLNIINNDLKNRAIDLLKEKINNNNITKLKR